MPLDMFPAPADETFAAGLTLGIDELTRDDPFADGLTVAPWVQV